MRSQRSLLVVALCALVALCAASRLSPSFLQAAHDSAPSVPLVGAQGNFGAFWREMVGRRREREEMEGTAYVLLRFTVPPSAVEDFEERWLDMQRQAYKCEKGLEFLVLHKHLLDNLFYEVYGEWESRPDALNHLQSDHFQKFSDFIDEYGVRWELHPLENVSEDVEEEQGISSRGRRVMETTVDRRRREERGQGGDWDKNIPEEYRKYIPEKYLPQSRRERQEEDYEALFTYVVPPTLREDFVSDWKDVAFKTLKEDGNTAITLRKARTDNTKFFGYGRWDSLEDFQDHFESRHVDRFRGRLADNDVAVFITPMVRIDSRGSKRT